VSLVQTFLDARAAFLTHNRHDLETYMAELSEAAATKALVALAEEYDLDAISKADIHAVSGRAAAQAVAHINVNDLPPRFFLTEPYFTLRKATKTRTAVVEAAKALVGTAGQT